MCDIAGYLTYAHRFVYHIFLSRLVSAGTGTQERGFAGLRYGDQSESVNYRGYAKYFYRDDNQLDGGGDANDTWEGFNAGFRTDTDLGENDLLTVQGDVSYSEGGWDYLRPSLHFFQERGETTRYYRGGNLLSRWTRSFSEESEMVTQIYYDHLDRNDRVLEQKRDTFDLDWQYRFAPAPRHELMVGAGYRIYSDDNMEGTFSVSVNPPSRTVDLYQAFFQDEITLVEKTLRLILGTKFESNELAGFELLPNARIIATPSENHSIWAAVSRAIRSPARFNHEGRLVLASVPGEMGLPNVVTLNGDPDYESEELIAYEVGLRSKITDQLSADLALFYNDYDQLESSEPAAAPFLTGTLSSPYIEVPMIVDNLLEGDTYGGELTVDWGVADWWKLTAYYAYIEIDLERTEGSVDQIYIRGEDQSPEHQAMLRSHMNLPYNMEFDAIYRYVSEVATFDIDDYCSLDLRLGWHITPDLELSVVGQNLLEDGHMEFESNLVDTVRTEVERGVYVKILWEI